jgi:Pentapeptide repeats (9 copies)
MADFWGAQFTGGTDFGGAQFTGEALFWGAQFTGRANFSGAQFMDRVFFEGARVASAAESGSVWPPGWTTRPAQPDNGEDPAFRYLTKVEDGNPSET